MASSAASEWPSPAAIPASAPWLAALVPGTVAQTLGRHGLWSLETLQPLDHRDYWYRATLTARGAHSLRFEGLATLCDVHLDGRLILVSRSMFESHAVDIALDGDALLHLCFRALRPVLDARHPRARWRQKLVAPPSLRHVRTSLLGYMPSWCPPAPCIGPWRAISLQGSGEPRAFACRIEARLDGRQGTLGVSVQIDGLPADGAPLLECGLHTAAFARAPDGAWRASLDMGVVEPWWPHTHGAPALYDMRVTVCGVPVIARKTGFRTLAMDRGADSRGFGLVVNGVPVFCRGANWMPPDLTSLADDAATLRPLLTSLRDAGMNMLRIPGNLYYGSDAFYALCDELGIMVWQDFPFANLDYPADDAAFARAVRREATQFLRRVQGAPSLVMLCGGSEIRQQAAMLGLPAEAASNPIFDELLPQLVAAAGIDAAYIPHSPTGGAQPFHPREMISHYYGVSAYMRPLADARLAQVRFASECLCFANVPDHVPVTLVPDKAEIEHRDFAPRVPYDKGAEWYFEDVRNHYLALLYDAEPEALRRADPGRYLDLSRAVSAEIMEHVFAEWRRPGSPTRGGLVWFLHDLQPGAGWGVLDSGGEPKAAFHGLRRAFRPVQVLLIDEGLNGLDVHLINETPTPVDCVLTLRCLQHGATIVMQAERALTLAPRATVSRPATELWGAFFDTTLAYKFGPPSHDVTIASLATRDGRVIARAFQFPQGRGHALVDTGLVARLDAEDGHWFVDVSCRVFAQSVCIEAAGYLAQDNWFHLAPGDVMRVRLIARDAAAPPNGSVRAVNDSVRVAFGAGA